MRNQFSCLLVVVAAVGSLRAETPAENPYKGAKVGDFISLKMTNTGVPGETLSTQKIVEKTDTHVTLEVTTTANGKDLPASKIKIDYTKPQEAPKDAKFETKKIDSGTETLTVNGKSLKCEWVKNKVTVSLGGKDFVSETTTWTSKEVPLNGVVKAITKSDLFNTTIELVDFGNKK